MRKGKNDQSGKAGTIMGLILFAVVLYPVMWILAGVLCIVLEMTGCVELPEDLPLGWYALALTVAACIALYWSERVKSDQQRKIEAQFKKDQTSICPRCGGENIKLYPKGYNYKMGFWGTLLGLKGAAFIAGMDSNVACCHCRNCGNDWETPYDFRSID